LAVLLCYPQTLRTQLKPQVSVQPPPQRQQQEETRSRSSYQQRPQRDSSRASNGTLVPSLPRIRSSPGSNNNYAAFASNNFGTLSNNNYAAFVASNDIQLSPAEETSTQASPKPAPTRPKKKNVANFVEPEEPYTSPTTEPPAQLQPNSYSARPSGRHVKMADTPRSGPANGRAPQAVRTPLAVQRFANRQSQASPSTEPPQQDPSSSPAGESSIPRPRQCCQFGRFLIALLL